MKLLLLISVCVVALAPAEASDIPGDVIIEEWPAEAATSIRLYSSELGDSLSNAIFRNVANVKLLSISGGSIGVQVKVRRHVYNNHDVLGSYSVIDTLRVPMNIPIYSGGDYPVGGGFFFGLSAGLKTGLEVMNIRQVMPEGLDRLPNINGVQRSIEDSDWFRNRDDIKEVDEDDDDDDDDVGAVAWPTPDPLRSARYSKFWNLLRAPFRLPFTTEKLNRLEDGEVMSYAVSGTVELGARIGWSFDAATMSDMLDMGIGLTTYLHGKFRVSVLKESQDMAVVKLTKVNERGLTIDIGMDGDKFEVFSGVMVWGKKIGKAKIKIIPFNVKIKKARTKIFDVGYRYNLKDSRARRAYELAMVGRFSLSAELAFLGITAVEKVFTRRTNRNTTERETTIRLAFLYSKKTASKREISDIHLTLPDGAYHIIRTSTVNQRQWKDFLHLYEKLQYQFIFSKLLNGELPTNDGRIGLMAQGLIEDSSTTGREINSYITELEHSIGRRNLIPRPPVYQPLGQSEQRAKRARYGRSNFFFRVYFTNTQVERFLNAKKEEMWPALEIAFGKDPGTWKNRRSRFAYEIKNMGRTLLNVPFYFFNQHLEKGSDIWHAKRLRRRWLKIQKAKDVQKQAGKVAKFFADKRYSYQILRLFRSFAEGEKIAYDMNAYNRSFGIISESGSVVSNINIFLERVDRLIAFDRQRMPLDPQAIVSNFKVTLNGKHKYAMEFNLERRPKLFYLRVGYSKRGKKIITKLNVIVPANLLKAGDNQIFIDPAGSAFERRLAASLTEKKNNVFSLAVSYDKRFFGPPANDVIFID